MLCGPVPLFPPTPPPNVMALEASMKSEPSPAHPE